MKNYELLLYRPNAAPSALAMLFLIFNTVQTIFTLNAVNIAAAGIRIMEIILMNILLSFLVFIAASEIKRYNTRWSWAALAVGIFQCSRYFFIPPVSQNDYRIISVSLLAAGFFLITASIWSLIKCGRYRAAKKELKCHTSA
jgi:hypothetical protein